jgi:tryptophanyl-tRNA synthetase
MKTKDIPAQCRSTQIGCVDCKKLLAQEVNAALAPLRERRHELASKPAYVSDVLSDGARRAQAISRETIREVKDRMNLIRKDT